MMMRAFDLFCGGGGSSWGAREAGATIVGVREAEAPDDVSVRCLVEPVASILDPPGVWPVHPLDSPGRSAKTLLKAELAVRDGSGG